LGRITRHPAANIACATGRTCSSGAFSKEPGTQTHPLPEVEGPNGFGGALVIRNHPLGT